MSVILERQTDRQTDHCDERDQRQKRPVVRETSGERDQWSEAPKILLVEKRISGDIGEIKEIFSTRLNIC